jgi:ADP-glucose pyrophosphorylase
MNLIKDGRPDIVIVFGADHVCRMDPQADDRPARE